MEAIDAVITWVDGADPNYQMKYRKYFAGRSNIKKQFLQSNEITLCIASILKYAPFIRKIFIVTDGQSPNLDEICLLYTSPSPRDATLSRMPSSA